VKTANDDSQGRKDASSHGKTKPDRAQEDEIDYGYGAEDSQKPDSNEEVESVVKKTEHDEACVLKESY
jgi:hypothetical protein